MGETPLYDNISKKYQYSNMSNWDLRKPFILWANTNSMLDKFYARPEINIDNSPEGLKRKNTMRHITGLGLVAREYNPYTAFGFGLGKEIGDFFTHKDVIDKFNKPLTLKARISNTQDLEDAHPNLYDYIVKP